MLNLIGNINDRSYGLVTYNFLVELSKLSPVKFWEIAQIQPGLNIDYELIKKARELPYSPQTSIRIYHQDNLAFHVGSPRIGFPFFELNKFTQTEKEHLKAQDGVIVASQWAKEIVAQINSNVSVVNLGVSEAFQPKQVNRSGPVKFLSIGKWEVRKGHDKLIDFFCRAFSPSDNVELYMACHNPFCTKTEIQDWHKKYLSSPLGDKIKIVPWMKTQEEVCDLMNRVDCGIFISRAEGWNLEATEMLACGKPIILTDYSGHSEFSQYAMKVEIDRLEPAYDFKWFFGHGDWAHLGSKQEEQIVEHLRYVYKNRPVIEPVKFSWADSAKTLLEIVS